MKKYFSISFAFLILISGMHLTVAIHYCGGRIADSKLSVSGELASCGMEECENHFPLSGSSLQTNCCKNKVSSFVVDNNFEPSVSNFKVLLKHYLTTFYIPVEFKITSLIAAKLISTSISPPGNFMVSAVSLPFICVFRN